jgi:hypothetical protein
MSQRKDFPQDIPGIKDPLTVFEVAFGADRMVPSLRDTYDAEERTHYRRRHGRDSGRLIGFNDVWRDNSTATCAFFVLWIPVWWRTFTHSTALFE